MTNEIRETIEIITAGLIYRLWSMFEHRRNGKREKENSEHIERIYLLMNGEVEKKIALARQEAIEEERKRHQKK